MLGRADTGNCDRARAWASLRLDGEISELEAAFLDSHLGRCAACREYEASVCGAVQMLREQPLAELRHPVVVVGRRRIPVRPAAVARVAALVAAVVGVATVLGTQSGKQPVSPSTASPPVVVTDDNSLEQLRALRVIQLGGRPARTSGVGSFGAVLARRP